MGRGSETQLQVGENLNCITWRFNLFQLGVRLIPALREINKINWSQTHAVGIQMKRKELIRHL